MDSTPAPVKTRTTVKAFLVAAAKKSMFVSQLALVGYIADYFFGGGAVVILAVTIGTIVSVLGHEAGHVHAAKRHGLQVYKVGISWFGAYTEHAAAHTKAQAYDLAARGLAYNALFALAFLGVTLVAEPGQAVYSAALTLAYFNVGVVLLNGVPIPPFDGGLIAALALSTRTSLDVGWRRIRRADGVVIGISIVGGLALGVWQVSVIGAMFAALLAVTGKRPVPELAALCENPLGDEPTA